MASVFSLEIQTIVFPNVIELMFEFDVQEGVAIEIAEAVVGALKGELAATAVNAPMVPAEVYSYKLVLYAYVYILFAFTIKKIRYTFLASWF